MLPLLGLTHTRGPKTKCIESGSLTYFDFMDYLIHKKSASLCEIPCIKIFGHFEPKHQRLGEGCND